MGRGSLYWKTRREGESFFRAASLSCSGGRPHCPGGQAGCVLPGEDSSRRPTAGGENAVRPATGPGQVTLAESGQTTPGRPRRRFPWSSGRLCPVPRILGVWTQTETAGSGCPPRCELTLQLEHFSTYSFHRRHRPRPLALRANRDGSGADATSILEVASPHDARDVVSTKVRTQPHAPLLPGRTHSVCLETAGEDGNAPLAARGLLERRSLRLPTKRLFRLQPQLALALKERPHRSKRTGKFRQIFRGTLPFSRNGNPPQTVLMDCRGFRRTG